jgi:2-polyprenyl-3-methyl-5-hydroxy-6-metoxy-1,4-benzoquinol methylase
MNLLHHVENSCTACRHRGLTGFFENPEVPVFCNVLWPDRSTALASPKAAIHLAFCPKCGLIYNIDFDSKKMAYSQKYENSLHYSGRFQKYAEDLACRLVKRYQLYHKPILEIGCGQGDFLLLLVEAGGNKAVGFDPGFDPARASSCIKRNITILPESFSSSHTEIHADFICCRQVLEHIASPMTFLRDLRKFIGRKKDTVVFFEVPNALYTLRDKGIWDIIYEHCSYFTVSSLATIFRLAGFDPIDVSEQYGGQFITIEARPASTASEKKMTDDMKIRSLLTDFSEMYRGKVGFWSRLIADQFHRKQRTVVWGAGSKGTTFLNTLKVSSDVLEYVVDLNPRKQGHFIPGTGQKIVPPIFLQQYDPHAVILMNPVYHDEIRHTLQKMNLPAETLLA